MRADARWRVLLTSPAPGAWNMALDDALMQRARISGECVLRVYRWSRPTLSFGRNQPARDSYSTRLLEQRGIDAVRRPTGGRTVLHHREITYSVTAPESALGRPKASYTRINAILLSALSALGAPALEHTTAERAPRPDLHPCFDVPTEGELVAAGRKLVGSAQVRSDGVLLQHGSILLEDDQSTVAELLGLEPSSPPATLRALLNREVTARELLDLLTRAIVTLEDSAASEIGVDAIPREELERAVARYADPDWTWKH